MAPYGAFRSNLWVVRQWRCRWRQSSRTKMVADAIEFIRSLLNIIRVFYKRLRIRIYNFLVIYCNPCVLYLFSTYKLTLTKQSIWWKNVWNKYVLKSVIVKEIYMLPAIYLLTYLLWYKWFEKRKENEWRLTCNWFNLVPERKLLSCVELSLRYFSVSASCRPYCDRNTFL